MFHSGKQVEYFGRQLEYISVTLFLNLVDYYVAGGGGNMKIFDAVGWGMIQKKKTKQRFQNIETDCQAGSEEIF